MDQATDPHKASLDIDRLCAAVANCAQADEPSIQRWVNGYNLGVKAAIRAIRAEAELAGYRLERAARLADLADVEPWTPSIDADWGRS